jgi:hypothetical protein
LQFLKKILTSSLGFFILKPRFPGLKRLLTLFPGWRPAVFFSIFFHMSSPGGTDYPAPRFIVRLIKILKAEDEASSAFF